MKSVLFQTVYILCASVPETFIACLQFGNVPITKPSRAFLLSASNTSTELLMYF